MHSIQHTIMRNRFASFAILSHIQAFNMGKNYKSDYLELHVLMHHSHLPQTI